MTYKAAEKRGTIEIYSAKSHYFNHSILKLKLLTIRAPAIGVAVDVTRRVHMRAKVLWHVECVSFYPEKVKNENCI